MNDLNVVDIWCLACVKHPGVQDYTYYSDCLQAYSRIDMIAGIVNVNSCVSENCREEIVFRSCTNYYDVGLQEEE